MERITKTLDVSIPMTIEVEIVQAKSGHWRAETRLMDVRLVVVHWRKEEALERLLRRARRSLEGVLTQTDYSIARK